MNVINEKVQVYLLFGGRCEEAIEFYKRTIGAEAIAIIRHKESPEPPPPGMLSPNWENKVMHASFRIGNTPIMASDGCGPEESGFKGFSLSLNVANADEANRVFGALLEGGKVKMPLTKTFFSPSFGMLADRFGVSWMIIVPQEMKAG
jgi:PhnB protein